MSEVYDWAGSLTPDILDFTLCDPTGQTLPPNKEVDDRLILTLIAASYTQSMSDDELQFNGFGTNSSSNDITIQDCEPCSKDDKEARNDDLSCI